MENGGLSQLHWLWKIPGRGKNTHRGGEVCWCVSATILEWSILEWSNGVSELLIQFTRNCQQKKWWECSCTFCWVSNHGLNPMPPNTPNEAWGNWVYPYDPQSWLVCWVFMGCFVRFSTSLQCAGLQVISWFLTPYKYDYDYTLVILVINQLSYLEGPTL